MISANLSFLDDKDGNLKTVGVEVVVGTPDPDTARRITLVHAPPVDDPTPGDLQAGEGRGDNPPD